MRTGARLRPLCPWGKAPDGLWVGMCGGAGGAVPEGGRFGKAAL